MTYASVIAADNPNRWWRLNEQGGVISFDTGSDLPHIPLTGQLLGWCPYTGPTSDGGASAKFDNGISSYINLGKGVPLLNLWTIEAWGYANSAAQQTIFSLYNQTTLAQIAIRLETTGFVTGYIGGGPVCNYNVNMGTDAWHHYALTYDHVNLKLYVDGVLRSTTAGVVSTTVAMSVSAGEAVGRSTIWSGFMAECAYYSAALTAAQIAAHYAAADIRTANAHFNSGGQLDPVTHLPLTQSESFDLIYNAVHRVYT